jgi:DNA-binding NtrC family response regulator
MKAPPRLLVVDDEPDLRTLYELTLVREGYDVESAAAVEEAWALLNSRGLGGFQLVITDMRLPDGNGLDLLRRMEEAGRPEKAIVITAYGSPENAVEALKAGAYDYLTKPVDLRQFRAAVASALGRTPAAPAAPTPVAPPAAPVMQPTLFDAADTTQSAALQPAIHPALGRIVGDTTAMQQVRSLVERVAKSWWRARSTKCHHAARRLLWPSTVVPSPRPCWRLNFLAIAKALSPAPAKTVKVFFKPHKGALCFWTRSATCRCRCKASCCG